MGPISEFKWVGSQTNYIDNIMIQNVNRISVGLFGGNSVAGQYKNEDGCLIWTDDKGAWEFVMILDGHKSAESVEIVIKQFSIYKERILKILALPTKQALFRLEETLLGLFQEEAFLAECRKVNGETACLIVLRKDKYVSWFSIGDCISYLFHPELAHLGQYQINQRQFFEWVGEVNTFDQAVPCYSKGIRELRKGKNCILLTTDGLVECPNEPFSNPEDIYRVMLNNSTTDGLMELLETIKENNVRDSTTIISWDVNISIEVSIPSDV